VAVDVGEGVDEELGRLITEERAVGVGDDVMTGVLVLVVDGSGAAMALVEVTALLVVVFLGKDGKLNAGKVKAGAAKVTPANASMEIWETLILKTIE
jgi:hypothetical protein